MTIDDGTTGRTARCVSLWTLCLVALLAGRTRALGGKLEFVARGEVRYEDKAWDWHGWTGERPTLPVRRADVTVLDAQSGKRLGRGSTDLDGYFEVACRAKGPLDVVVRIDASTKHHKKAFGKYQRLEVETAHGDLWSAYTSTLSTHDPSTDAEFPPLVIEPVALLGQEGHPFNVFDMAVAAFDLVSAPPRSAKPRGRLRIVWPNSLGSFAIKRQAWIATDDGYDDAVILHEVGHLVHNVHSDSDNPGGAHVFGHSDQDPRLSFGEGYATFFAGAVLDALGREPMYIDCDGGDGVGGVELRLRLEDAAPYTSAAIGACDEVAVACVLHDLVDDEHTVDGSPGVDDDPFDSTVRIGDEQLTPTDAWWRVFTKRVRRARHATANDVWDGWLRTHASAPRADALKAVFGSADLVFWDDETELLDDVAAPLSAPGPTTAWSPVRTLYRSKGDAPEVDGVGIKDGKGDEDEWVVWLTAGQTVTVETRYPDDLWDAGTQADPYIQLRRPSGKLAASDDDSGTGRNARISGLAVDETGPWRVVVTSKNRIHRYGRYQLRVRLGD